MFKVKAYSAAGAATPFSPDAIWRRDPTDYDVQIDILFCGICPCDLRHVRGERPGSAMSAVYPCVPGHEIIGRVVKVGQAVTRHRPGDLVGVGHMVDADSTCPHCLAGLEQFCLNQTLTYGSPDEHLGGVTRGGWSECIVVDEHFVLSVPPNLDPAGAAPLLCAGIRAYSPMRHRDIGKGMKVGVVGLGGIGHLGVKFARAFGAHVVVFTDSPDQNEDAMRLGAHETVVSRHADEMKKHVCSLDFILDCAASEHDINAYIQLLARDGNLTLVEAPVSPLPVSTSELLVGRRSLSGSPPGSIAETREMLEFCRIHGITAGVEVIPIQQLNEACEKLLEADGKYRFAIDMDSLRSE